MDSDDITHLEPESAPPVSSPAILQPGSTVTTNDSSMDIDQSASATEPSNPVPMEVDQPSSFTASSTDLNVVPIAPPAWLTALKMDIYFQECSDTTAWQLLVQSFYKFEAGDSVNGVCR